MRLGLERERNDRRRPKMAICGVFGVAKQMPRCPMTSDPKRACSTSLGTQGRRTKPTQGQGQRRSYALGNVDHLGRAQLKIAALIFGCAGFPSKET